MLGLAEEALQTYEEAIELVQDTSRNFLAHVLVNRAHVLSYLGRYAAALADFRTGLAHFERMRDDYGLVETHLLWGYEYHGARDEWQLAEAHFAKAAQIIHHKTEGYQEEHLRLLLGRGQAALAQGNVAEAHSFLTQAETLSQKNTFVWWKPAVAYLHGRIALAQGEKEEGVSYLLHVQSLAEEEGGNPEYWPLALLALAQNVSDPGQKQTYFRQCVTAVTQRGRFSDKIKCLQTAGYYFLSCEQPALQEHGQNLLQRAASLTATIPRERG
jgi:tetratricopeptide (TPR) repeat protein